MQKIFFASLLRQIVGAIVGLLHGQKKLITLH